MAARRGKSQARRNASSGLPGWAWLVIGILLTLLAVLLVPRYLKSDGGDGFFRPKPNPDALPAAVSDEGDLVKAWGGISSLQIGLSIVLTGCLKRNIPVERIADWMSAAPASHAA